MADIKQRVEGKPTVEYFVLTHTVWVPVATEADYDEALFLGHDSLINCSEISIAQRIEE
jgi:hypothetical protein